MVSYIKKAVKSTLIIYLFAVIGSIFAYLVRILFAHNMSVAEYGLFFAALGLISLVFTFKDLGYGAAVIRFIPEFQIKKQGVNIKSGIVFAFIIQLVYSIIGLVVFFIIADLLATYYFHDALAVNLIKILVVWQLFNVIINCLIQGFLGFQRFFLWAAINHLSMLAIFILSVIFFNLGVGYTTPALAYMIYPIIFSIIFVPIFLTKVYPGFLKEKVNISKKLIKKLTKFSIPQILSNSSSMIMGFIDTIMLTVMVGVTGVGIYHVAMPTSRLTIFFGDGLSTFLMPFVAELWTKKHMKHLVEGISLIYKYIFMLIVPIVFIIFAFSDLIIKLLFGADYILADRPLKILIFGMVAFTIFIINSAILLGINKPKINAKILFIAVIFNVIANFVLISLFDVTGAALATTLSFILLLFLSLYYVRKFIKIKIPIVYWLKIILVGILMVLLVYLLKWLIELHPYLETCLILVIIGIAYLFTLYITKLLDIEEVKMILERIGIKDKLKSIFK